MEILKCGAERRFIVLNIELIKLYLGMDNLKQLECIVKDFYKELPKEKQHEYLVINTDESYINDVIKILQDNGHWPGYEKDKR